MAQQLRMAGGAAQGPGSYAAAPVVVQGSGRLGGSWPKLAASLRQYATVHLQPASQLAFAIFLASLLVFIRCGRIAWVWWCILSAEDFPVLRS